jgi:hypothetical protein
MKKTMKQFLIIVLGGLTILGIAGCHESKDGLVLPDDPIRCKEIVLHILPVGTTSGDAYRIMKDHGFCCTLYTNSLLNLDGRYKTTMADFVMCDMISKSASMVHRRWQIALITQSNRVQDVSVTTELIGP